MSFLTNYRVSPKIGLFGLLYKKNGSQDMKLIFFNIKVSQIKMIIHDMLSVLHLQCTPYV